MLKKIKSEAGDILQYLAGTQNDNTVRFLLHYPGPVDADTLSAGFGSVVKRKPSFQVAAISMDGACSLSVCIQATDEDEAQIRKFLDDMAAEIAAYAES